MLWENAIHLKYKHKNTKCIYVFKNTGNIFFNVFNYLQLHFYNVYLKQATVANMYIDRQLDIDIFF